MAPQRQNGRAIQAKSVATGIADFEVISYQDVIGALVTYNFTIVGVVVDFIALLSLC
ncbi:hypothetical protein C2G38_2188337 [Gigaspora rosea]|uniref:Uncharacterized protein n=1 Tax=Gigaspora rosea TaxID=44941 RepID=A0A397V3M2_9GLOM|nr:hypothetical protein C2G38_2188337 [Gigaspora rosea]